MFIYNPSLFIAPIQPPQVGLEVSEPSDDRSEVAEVEAVYESFEEDLTTQVRCEPFLVEITAQTACQLRKSAFSKGL